MFRRLSSPAKIQAYLNRLKYDSDYAARSLNLADEDLVKAGLLGAKKSRLFKPKK